MIIVKNILKKFEKACLYLDDCYRKHEKRSHVKNHDFVAAEQKFVKIV
jgi:hypothetical protein